MGQRTNIPGKACLMPEKLKKAIRTGEEITPQTTEQAAEYIGISPDAIRYHIRKGHIPAEYTAGVWWIYSDDLQEWKLRRAKSNKC